MSSEKQGKRQAEYYREQAVLSKQAQAMSDAHFKRNLAEQERFAKNKIRWATADARAAGLSPLHAMGMGQGFSPVMSGGYQAGPSGSVPSTSENALKYLGQGISRVTRNYMSQEQRAINDISLENGRLKNDYLRTQIASEQARLRQYENPTIQMLPHRAVVSSKTNPSQEPGTITDTGYADTPTGLTPVPSKDVKQRVEDNEIAEAAWSFRNYGRGVLGTSGRPSDAVFLKRFPKAIGQRFDRFLAEYVPIYRRGVENDWYRKKGWEKIKDYWRYSKPHYFKLKRRQACIIVVDVVIIDVEDLFVLVGIAVVASVSNALSLPVVFEG